MRYRREMGLPHEFRARVPFFARRGAIIIYRVRPRIPCRDSSHPIPTTASRPPPRPLGRSVALLAGPGAAARVSCAGAISRLCSSCHVILSRPPIPQDFGSVLCTVGVDQRCLPTAFAACPGPAQWTEFRQEWAAPEQMREYTHHKVFSFVFLHARSFLAAPLRISFLSLFFGVALN